MIADLSHDIARLQRTLAANGLSPMTAILLSDWRDGERIAIELAKLNLVPMTVPDLTRKAQSNSCEIMDVTVLWPAPPRPR